MGILLAQKLRQSLAEGERVSLWRCIKSILAQLKLCVAACFLG
jgi:hypothetical protein